LRRVPLDCVVRCPVIRRDVCRNTFLLEKLTERRDMTSSADEQDWPLVEAAKLRQPIAFALGMALDDALRNFGLRPTGQKGLGADVALLIDLQFDSFAPIGIAEPVSNPQ